jgi:hypothetical protein
MPPCRLRLPKLQWWIAVWRLPMLVQWLAPHSIQLFTGVSAPTLRNLLGAAPEVNNPPAACLSYFLVFRICIAQRQSLAQLLISRQAQRVASGQFGWGEDFSELNDSALSHQSPADQARQPTVAPSGNSRPVGQRSLSGRFCVATAPAHKCSRNRMAATVSCSQSKRADRRITLDERPFSICIGVSPRTRMAGVERQRCDCDSRSRIATPSVSFFDRLLCGARAAVTSQNFFR